MVDILSSVAATPDIPGNHLPHVVKEDGIWPGQQTTPSTPNILWDDLELSEDGSPMGGSGRSLDLHMLWQVLERHKEQMAEKEVVGNNIDTTWELVVIQGVLLTMLVLISLSWAFCCKKRCFSYPETVTVSEALRKLSTNSTKSKDLPPSYSIMDLHSLGISVQDHLNPPPTYLDLFRDTDLQYLDLEAGHARMAKLSFCGDDSSSEVSNSPPRLARVSVASCATCNSESPVIVPIKSHRSSVSSSSSASSRRTSRNSRVSFSEEVECSNGSIRRLSSNTLSGLGATSSRRSSSSSSEGGSRKSSLLSAVQRKIGSHSPAVLEAELKSKLARVEQGDVEEVVTAERQAERAARVCDIIVEEK